MEQKLITKESQDLAYFDQVFTEAFPPAERLLPSDLVGFEGVKLNGFYVDGKPAGMLVTVDFPGLVYILFLATSAEFRGQGIGSKIINTFYANNPNTFTIGVIEKPMETAENNAQRIARQKFYERLGYSVYDFDIKFRGCDFLVIAKGNGSDNMEMLEKKLEQLREIVVSMGIDFEQ
mgnify:FL=1